MSITDILIMSLAVYSVTYMLVYSDGPWGSIEKLRYTAGVRYDEYGNERSDTVLGQILMCHVCTGFWVVIPIVILYVLSTIIVSALAVHGLSIVLFSQARDQ